MDLAYCRTRLRQSAAAIVALAQGVTPEQARWKPTPEEWSLLEVICHLYDEEREDFRQRLDLTLHHPEADWPPIHPVGMGYGTRLQPARSAGDGGRLRAGTRPFADVAG